MAELKIIYKSIDEITPYLNNPRKNDKAIDPVAESIKQFGFKVPVILDKNGIIVAGHTRIKAAKKLGIREIPCIIADDLNEEQIRALRIADNKVAEFAEWDQDALLKELKEIVNIDMDVFGLKHIEPLSPDDVIEDNPPDVPKTAKTKRGELYQLGDNVLMCGDSTSDADVKRLMDGTEADCVVTDPPYGVAIGDKNKMLNHVDGGRGKKRGRVDVQLDNDDLTPEAMEDFLTLSFATLKNALKTGGAFYIFHPDAKRGPFLKALEANNMELRQILVWVKSNFAITRQDYQWQHEPCIYGWKEGAGHFFINHRDEITTIEEGKIDVDKMSKEQLAAIVKDIYENRSDVVRENKPQKNAEHPTMKPIKLCARFIFNSTKKGETVLDLFGGSGSTLIAAEQLGRKCRMMEYDPRYCDVIIERWENLTGRKAVKIA